MSLQAAVRALQRLIFCAYSGTLVNSGMFPHALTFAQTAFGPRRMLQPRVASVNQHLSFGGLMQIRLFFPRLVVPRHLDLVILDVRGRHKLPLNFHRTRWY